MILPAAAFPLTLPIMGLLDPSALYIQQKYILGAPEDGYVIVTGGAGTLKTSGCVLKLYERAIRDYRIRDMVLMQTQEHISRVFIEQWESIVPADHYSERTVKGNWFLELFNGARILLQYADHPKAAARIRGANLSGYFISQAESLTYEDLIEEIELRVRIAGPEHLRMMDANGGNPSRPALRRYVEAASGTYHARNLRTVLTKAPGITIRTGRAKNNCRFTHIHIITTPETSVYSADDIAGFKSSLTSVAFDRMIAGKNVLDEGLVYQDWNPAVHVRDFKANPGWVWYRAVDWGYENPFACLWVGVDADDRFWVYREFYQKKLLIDAQIREVKDRDPEGVQIRLTYADPSDAANIMAFNQAGMPALGGVNRIDFGLGKVRGLLRIRDDGLPGLIVHPLCSNIIFEFSAYEMTKSTAAVPVPTAPRKENDHALDALRYLAASLLAFK